MTLLKPIVIIFSFISFISCGDTKTNGTSIVVPNNRVYLKVTNNTPSDISYKRETIHCKQELNFDSSEFDEWSPVCEIIENDYSQVYLGEKYWGTNTPPISSATLKPSKSATSYGHLGNATKTGSDVADFLSFIITVTINGVSKKIVGFNEELYKKLFNDKPLEFFDDVISYGTFYGVTLNSVIPTDFEYNPCFVGAHTTLTDYATFSLTARYYLDITVKDINTINVSLDQTKSRIGDSGYVKATNECKFYMDENVRGNKGYLHYLFPFHPKDDLDIPKDLTGRIYVITEPGIGDKIIGYGADPE